MDRLLPWLRRAGWAWGVAAILLAVLAWRVADRPGTGVGTEIRLGDRTTAAEADSAPKGGLVVHVAGAVKRPGVYSLASSARVRQAVGRAGGPTRRAALSQINLAAPLQDGQQVVVPVRGRGGAGGAGGEDGGPISISSASAEELQQLDGIGPTLAGRIVEERQARGGFASIDDLDEVPGIGPARLEALRDKVVP
jgi:competence protein ComEA